MEQYGMWLIKSLSINANIILYTTKREGVDLDLNPIQELRIHHEFQIHTFVHEQLHLNFRSD